MGTEEDKKFDAVVAGFVHRNLREQAARIHCPQPDLLAAYHERSLAPQELSQWKEHIAGCAPCQEVLAQLEITEGISLESNREEQVPVMLAASDLAAPRMAAGASAPAPRAANVRDIPARRSPFFSPWRVAAPVGAIAAGFLIWFAVRETRLHQRPAEIAENRPAPVLAAPSPAQASPQFSEADLEKRNSGVEKSDRGVTLKNQATIETHSGGARGQEENKKAGAAGEPAGAFDGRIVSALPPARTREQAPALDFKALRQKSEQTQSKERRAADETQLQAAAAPPPPPPPLAVPGTLAKMVPASPAEKAAAPATANETVDIASSTSAVSAEAVQGDKVATRKDALSKQKASHAEIAAHAAPLSGNRHRDEDAFSTGHVGNGIIRAPGGKVAWIAGAGGQILNSLDGAKTWKTQASGITLPLSAGSAPSEGVCWVVGAGGTILRTTDGGEHWQRISPPAKPDFTGVTASDAENAVIWSQSPALTYTTTDGGKSWSIANTK
jgi:hypothetical protein